MSIAMERELLYPLQQVSGMESVSAEIGNRVSFRISDVYLPEPSEVLAHLSPETEANGVVVEFSDSGSNPRAYAVVRLTAEQSVLLPVTALRVVASAVGDVELESVWNGDSVQ
ncbi:MAG: hypothetical protein ACRD45_15060 [Bryobacteraceae bacterium]